MAKKKLQVFISSTYTDLIIERQEAVQAVLDAGHIPAGMELFKAGNETQLDTIYKWIDNSDVYMLILGGRYGSVEEKTGKSYTRLEYEYALKKGIPVFSVVLTDVFLKSKAASNQGIEIFEQTHIEKYNAFRKQVLTKIVRMVDDAKDIKLAIHTTLVDFLEEYQMVGWIRANESEANVGLLIQINDLNNDNKKLLEVNQELKKKIDLLESEFDSNLAFEGDLISICGSYTENIGRNSNYVPRTRSIDKSIALNELFLLWAPRLTATIHSPNAKTELEKSLLTLMGRNVTISDELFHKIKIQFHALGLLRYYAAKTTKGGTAEFISLTPEGHHYLITHTAIKKNF